MAVNSLVRGSRIWYCFLWYFGGRRFRSPWSGLLPGLLVVLCAVLIFTLAYFAAVDSPQHR